MLEPIENVLEISVFITHIVVAYLVAMHYDFSNEMPEKKRHLSCIHSQRRTQRAMKQHRRFERFTKCSCGIISNDPRRTVYYCRRTFSNPCVSVVERRKYGDRDAVVQFPSQPCWLFDSVLTRISTCERSFSAVAREMTRFCRVDGQLRTASR